METNLKVGLKGRIQVFKNGVEVLNEPNTIHPNALVVVSRCLGGTPEAPAVDTITFSGSVIGNNPKQVIEAYYLPGGQSMVFRAIALEGDFSGTIENFTLSSTLAGTLATKSGYSIDKDDITRMEVRWTITIILTDADI